MEAKILWGALSLLRIVWCLLPQPGYIHPDEFFQSPEVIAGDILDLEINRPWEFQPAFACRTVLFPLLTSGVAFWIIKIFHPICTVKTFSSSYVLLVIPRLFITILSFLVDYFVYRIAPIWGSDCWKALNLLAASYVTLVFYTRTTSNAIEGIMFALILFITRPGINLKNQCKLRSGLLIGIVLAAGFFNRPTFLGFAFIPVLYWAGKCNNTLFSFKTAFVHILQLLPTFVITAIIFIVSDTVYYRGFYLFSVCRTQTSTDCVLQNIVLTPLNFLRYNLNPENLAVHGTHPPITHLAVNAVMLFGSLHLSAASEVVKLIIYTTVWRMKSNHSDYKKSFTQQHCLLLCFYFMPLILLSLFKHQEPRFLIPLLLPLILFASQHNQKIHLKCVIIFNILGALFFGTLHQGGLVPSLAHIQRTVHSACLQNNSSHYTVLFTHTYMPPKHLFFLKKGQNSVRVIDLAGFDKDHLCQKLIEMKSDLLTRTMLQDQRKQVFLIVFPGTIAPVVDNCKLVIKEKIFFFPHLSMEDPPHIGHMLKDKVLNLLALHLVEVNIPER
ncbi:hypothetical protein GDO86_010028 [Hymenochirus boettgeri]|uniref:Mannosyltransferase n=1 Tax=Hymenochirus boettgeri TaxID=247094 RepID=A0A8T2JNI7_9PIPI|nr:hypothetical protein GDO86_010028 [Hymenochirus boettgeri]KAG8445103.1 hypothetical protein GDO86_010028 [Hymenochirus boettgeri]